jgi:ribosomal protein L37AE/L43A
VSRAAVESRGDRIALDARSIALARRWARAHPPCPECTRPCHYLAPWDVWVCEDHGDQWTGAGLATIRGFRVVDAPAVGMM